MATLRNIGKLAAVAKESQQERPRNSQSRNTALSRSNEDYITQMSEEIEGRVTKKLSQDSSRTESRVLAALTKLEEVLLKPHVRPQSETDSAISRSFETENQEPNEDRSQNGPRPEVGTSIYRSPEFMSSDPDEASYSIS